MNETRGQAERDLRTLGERFAQRFNMLVDRLESATTDEELRAFEALPTAQRLEAIESFARGLTTTYPWVLTRPLDQRYMAEIRCIISDAVLHAQQLNYAAAAECVQRAMRKLTFMRDRNERQAKMPPEMAEAIREASTMMVEVIQLFMDAEKVMSDASSPVD